MDSRTGSNRIAVDQDGVPRPLSPGVSKGARGTLPSVTLESTTSPGVTQTSSEGDDKGEKLEISSSSNHFERVVSKVDAATQTEEIYFDDPDNTSPPPAHNDNYYDKIVSLEKPVTGSSCEGAQSPIDVLTAKLYKLPLIDTPSSRETTQRPPKPPSRGIQLSRRVGGHSLQQQVIAEKRATLPLQRSINKQLEQQSLSKKLYDADVSKVQRSELLRSYMSTAPRTVDSTRRMVQLFTGYSRTNAQRQFHQQYQELPPDLRQFGIRKGKRHVIHGTNAYYYH